MKPERDHGDANGRDEPGCSCALPLRMLATAANTFGTLV
jgi:hypothetical protein